MKGKIILLLFFLDAFSLSAQTNNGPWNSPLMIATSSDGTNFSNQQVFQDSSGVPSVARISAVDLIAAFQWFPAPLHGRHWDSVAVKFSHDKGVTWGKPQAIIVAGLPGNFQRPFDPAITITDDGKYRIYFSSGLTGLVGLTANVDTYSALSFDGNYWTKKVLIVRDKN